jgi:hypothetical protein
LKILLLDIETAPNLVHVWGLWKQNVGINQIQAAGYVMCWAAKWYGQREVFFDSVHQSKTKKMLTGIHRLIDQADAIVHFNGKSFDMPTLNKEFILHGFKPPAPYKQVDLCLVARSEFRFPSNKLEYIARALGVGGKVKHEGHELWTKCMANGHSDDIAWAKMRRYNIGDVKLLEEVYEEMRPWIRQHPSHGLYDEPGIPVCTNCGSGHLQRRGYARTAVNKFARFQCVECGTWCREAISELPKEDRQMLLRRDLG